MKTLFVVLFFVFCLFGCDRSKPARQSTARNDNQAAVRKPRDQRTARIDNQASIRDVTFRSHLHGELNGDPKPQKGETIRVIPDPSEPMGSHESIFVQLPQETPSENGDELYFLRGYAIGQLSAQHTQYL